MRHVANLMSSHRILRVLALAWFILSLVTTPAGAQRAISSASSPGGTPTLVGQAQPAATSPAAQPSLLILPINRAKFLAGARFDFRVEANHVPVKPTVWDVSIAGKTPEVLFGTQGQTTNTSETSQEQTFRDAGLIHPDLFGEFLPQ